MRLPLYCVRLRQGVEYDRDDVPTVQPLDVLLENVPDLFPFSPQRTIVHAAAGPFRGPGLAREPAVLAADAESADGAEVALEKVARPARDDPEAVARVGCQRVEDAQQQRRRDGRLRILDVRGERAVVVEQDEPLRLRGDVGVGLDERGAREERREGAYIGH